MIVHLYLSRFEVLKKNENTKSLVINKGLVLLDTIYIDH